MATLRPLIHAVLYGLPFPILFAAYSVHLDTIKPGDTAQPCIHGRH